MSFFTTLSYYRPCKPPPMTANDLSRFIAAIRDTGTVTDAGLLGLDVKFGEAIDQDDRGVMWRKRKILGISEICEIDWDVELSDPESIQEIIDGLASDQRHIYRATVGLGQPINSVLRPITRKDSPENEVNYYPDDLSIRVRPVECFNLASAKPVLVGWLSLDLSGGGYLYPWTFRDAVDRLHACPEIQHLMEVCRNFWPVPADRPDRRTIKARNKLKDLWPYDECDKPWDWYWGVRESG